MLPEQSKTLFIWRFPCCALYRGEAIKIRYPQVFLFAYLFVYDLLYIFIHYFHYLLYWCKYNIPSVKLHMCLIRVRVEFVWWSVRECFGKKVLAEILLREFYKFKTLLKSSFCYHFYVVKVVGCFFVFEGKVMLFLKLKGPQAWQNGIGLMIDKM